MAVDVPRSTSTLMGYICLGLLAGPIGVLLLVHGQVWWVSAPLAAIGVPLVIASVWLLISRPPRLRLDGEGIRFGRGGSPVPWHLVERVGTGVINAPLRFGGGRHRVLTFTFRDRADALRHVPLLLRVRGRGGIGDLDVAASEFRDDLGTVIGQIRSARPS
jgi:hypothetical protein